MPRQSQVRAARELQPTLDANAIRLRAARAAFVSAIAAAMLDCVARGMSPPWWKGADQSSKMRWNMFDYLDGLLSQAGGDVPIGMPPGSHGRELRELVADAEPHMHLHATVIRAGYTLADTIDAVETSA